MPWLTNYRAQNSLGPLESKENMPSLSENVSSRHHTSVPEAVWTLLCPQGEAMPVIRKQQVRSEGNNHLSTVTNFTTQIDTCPNSCLL